MDVEMSVETAAPSPILQFGTGRFLQAHVGLFVSEAAESGAALGGITVVQSTDDPASTRRAQALAGGEGVPIVLRGAAAVASGRGVDGGSDAAAWGCGGCSVVEASPWAVRKARVAAGHE